jgi:hypothetical protein
MQGQAYRHSLAVDLSSVQVRVATGISSTLSSNSGSIPRRYGELLKAEIEDNINPDSTRAEKLFMLDITFSEADIALFVNPDGTASRGDLNYNSNYTIKRLKDNKTVASGTLHRVSSYNSSPTADYASFTSIEDARKRGMIELAEDYKLRIASLLVTLNTPDASAIEAKPDAAPALQPLNQNETLRTRN